MTPARVTLFRPIWPMAALCALSMLAAVPAQAQDQAFKDAMAARDDKKWPQVVTLLRQAIQANAQESDRKVDYGGFVGIGRRNSDYLPYYFLGEALFNRDDCAGAVDAWSTSEKQGVVRTRSPFMATIQNGYVVCEAKGVLPPSKFDPLLARANQQYVEANAIAAAVSNLGQQNLDQWRSDMRDQYEKASAELESSRARFALGMKSRLAKDLTDAISASERARGILVGIQSSLRTAVDRVSSVQSLASDVDQALSRAYALDRQIDGRIEARKTGLPQSLAAVRDQGREALSRARERQTSGLKSSNAAVLTEARALGLDASSRFKEVLDDLARAERSALARQLADAQTRAVQASMLLDRLFATLDQRLAANPASAADVMAERDAARKQADTARRRLEAASKSEHVPGIVQATRLTYDTHDRLNTLLTRFGPITLRERGVSQALEEGSRLFLAGRYQEALAALTPAGGLPADDPLQVHVHLFRAAALYARFAQSGETDQSLRVQALAEIEACKKIDSMFQPDSRAFSPRFISFFQSGSAASGTDAAPPP